MQYASMYISENVLEAWFNRLEHTNRVDMPHSKPHTLGGKSLTPVQHLTNIFYQHDIPLFNQRNMITCGRTLQEMCKKPAKRHLVKYYQTAYAWLLSWMVMCMEERTCGLKNIGNIRALSDFKEQCRKYVYCWVQIRGTNSYFQNYFGSDRRKKSTSKVLT